MKHKQRHNDEGYTITELLVVLVVLGLIAAAVSPSIMGRLDSAKVRSARLQLEMLATSLDAFYLDMERYPTQEEGLQVLLAQPADGQRWLGPYVKSSKSLIDPWGQAVGFNAEDQQSPIVFTLGADKLEGGEGSAMDLRWPEQAVKQ